MDKKIKVGIIGAGDVVRVRIKPALEKLNCIVTLFSNEKLDDVILIDDDDFWINEVKKSDIVWIATPSYVHVYYLKKLIDIVPFIVIEKPITCIKKELDEVFMLSKNREYRTKMFFTSYYLLEKALPLNYLQFSNDFYKDYLDVFVNDKLTPDLNMRMVYKSLGDLKNINVYIIEGIDKRVWPYLNENGTHMLETFLHNMLICTLFTYGPYSWRNVQYIAGNCLQVEDELSSSFIQIKAVDNHTKVNLLMSKNQPKEVCNRGAKLVFDKGFVNADFEKCEITVKFNNSSEIIKIKLKDDYANTKYLTQADLVLRCFSGEFKSYRVDNLYSQLEAIDWILEKKDNIPDKII